MGIHKSSNGHTQFNEHFDELMSRVISNLMHEVKVIKIADDPYTDGNTMGELLNNWEQILQRFNQDSHHLSATKTVVYPYATAILDCVLSLGSI